MKTQFWDGLRPIMPHSEVNPDWDLKNTTLFLRKHLTHLLWTRCATGFLCRSPRLLAVPDTEPGLPARDAGTIGLRKEACVSGTDTCNRVPHCWKRRAQHFTGTLRKRVGVAARRQVFLKRPEGGSRPVPETPSQQQACRSRTGGPGGQACRAHAVPHERLAVTRESC